MQKKNVSKKVLAGFAAGAALAVGSQAHAFSAPGVVEGFEGDTDAFTPNDPTIPYDNGGTNGYPGLRPGDITGGNGAGTDDWTDVRGGTFGTGAGLIEEVPSGFNGVTSYAGANHGIYYWDFPAVNGYYGGPIGRAGRDGSGSSVVNGMFASRVAVYADSNQPFTNDGATNGVWDSSASKLGGGYLTESSILFEPRYYETAGTSQSPAVNAGVDMSYRFQVGGYNEYLDVYNLDQWYIMEMVFDSNNGLGFSYLYDNDPGPGVNLVPGLAVAIHHNIIDGVTNQLLASWTHFDYLNGAYGLALGGPRTAFWFFNGNYSNNANMTNPTGIAIDNAVAGAAPLFVPEPASMALLGAGSLLMLRRRKA